MLREIADIWIVAPIGERVIEFNGLMTLSESGALLWKALESGADSEKLVQILLSEYLVDEDTAKKDVTKFIEELKVKEILE